MMRILYAKDVSLEALKGAPMEADDAIEAAAERIIADVRARGDAALATLTAEVQEMVRERKGPVHAPKRVIVADALPLTALGKPDKKAVRAQFWEGAERSVG